MRIGEAAAEPCIVVAMNGGVDSSVAAGLLVRAGYCVVGATMLLSAMAASFQRSAISRGFSQGC